MADFTTYNHLQLARDLSDVLFDTIRADESLGGANIADRLTRIRNVVWPDTASDKTAMHRVFREVLQGLNPNQKTQLLEAYARMGHVYEIAGLAARHHFLEAHRKTATDDVEAFIAKQDDAATAVEKLAQPVFEVVMTMHPTNTHSIESMQAQRELLKAAEAGNAIHIRSAIEAMAGTPVLHQQDGRDSNFTVRDETAVVLHYLDNIYEDLPKAYERFDEALAHKFPGYRPLDLKLNLRLGSWGSAGDKDGNNSVTADTTLEAIAMHTAEIVDRYKNDLQGIHNAAITSWRDQLTNHSKQLQGIEVKLSQLRQQGNVLRKNPGVIGASAWDARFDALSHQLAEIRQHLDPTRFESDLTQAYEADHNPKILEMIRKVRTFGFGFSKIEYRETSKEYSRVVAALVDGYDRLPPEQRVAKLTELLTAAGNQPEKLLASAREKIVREGAAQGYSKTDAMPIAYHTMKRMELARDFPDMIQDNVLAECGRINGNGGHDVMAQGTANILEAQFVQRMTGEKDGKRPLLGIIPLFEEPDTMKSIDRIMKAAYENKAYRQHMDALAPRNGGQPTQQVQIAHSDNARRSGLLAARAYIHEAHKKMRALNEEHGIKTQFFEGGSLSDAYRNGVRAVSASVNAFDLHDFIKFTFQGGDLVNYFSAPSSTVRLLTRNITHAANRFDKVDGRWSIRNRSTKGARAPNVILDEIAIEALKKTLDDYQRDDFKKDTMGVLLAALDYHGETKAGNRGSRAAARGQLAFGTVNGVQAGALVPVDIEDVRTIAFSEAWQHAGIMPSWIGSQNLAAHLLEGVQNKLSLIGLSPKPPAEQEFLDGFGNLADGSTQLSPAQIHTFYEQSPTFRDAQDRSAFALAMTDPESLRWLEKRLIKMSRGVDGDNLALISKAEDYRRHIESTRGKAAELAGMALTQQEAPQGGLTGSARVHMATSLPHLVDDMERKSNYRDFLLYIKIKGGGLDDHQRGVIHNAGDTVVHGRFLAADDLAYGDALLRKSRVEMAARAAAR